jgi:hypothetical protein
MEFLPEDCFPETYLVQDGVFKLEESTKSVYYQVDFDAAILDIFGENEEEDGLIYANWLEMVSFVGPVILNSLRNVPFKIFSNLSSIHRTSKHDGEAWLKSIIQHLNGGYVQFKTICLPSCGVYGFKRSSQIEHYAKTTRAFGSQRVFGEIDVLWLSDTGDRKLEKDFLDFLYVEDSVRRLNHRPKFKNAFQDYSLDNIEEVINFIFSKELKKVDPRLVLIDVGETLSDKQLDQIVNGLILQQRNERSSKWHPLIGVFCNRTENISSEKFDEIQKYCISLIPREVSVKDPATWAYGSIRQCITSLNYLNLYQKHSQAGDEENKLIESAKRKYFQTYLDILIFARAKSRVFLDGNVASLLPWLTKVPLAVADSLNSSNADQLIRKVKKDLIQNNHLLKERAKSIKAISRVAH